MASSYIRGQRVGAAAPQLIISIFCLLSPVFCCAEVLPDPTRPPAGIIERTGDIGGGREETGNQSGLHSIFISATRRAAIIDGQTVELGGVHGKARLIEVNEGGVVLQRAQSRQVLKLFPDVFINRKATPGKVSAEPGKISVENESHDNESQVRQPSSAMQLGNRETRPTAHREGK